MSCGTWAGEFCDSAQNPNAIAENKSPIRFIIRFDPQYDCDVNSFLQQKKGRPVRFALLCRMKHRLSKAPIFG
ncbi:MAG: hypothetical protein JWR26_2712 [Pedosphaera sp.]|nr:hypothetical protein [Pedosphaera sp.]